jgi:hypothetical protein
MHNGPMARLKTHKIAVRTRGLTDEDAARLHYLIAAAAHALADEYETASNVPVRTLRAVYPDDDWHIANRQDRLDLVF